MSHCGVVLLLAFKFSLTNTEETKSSIPATPSGGGNVVTTAAALPEQLIVYAGDNLDNLAVINCSANKGIKSYYWTLNGNRLEKSNRYVKTSVSDRLIQLTIKEPNTQDDGSYLCHVTATDGTTTTSTEAKLLVNVRPSNTENAVVITRNQNETISCPRTSQNAIVWYWIRHGVQLRNGSKYLVKQHSLTIFNVQDYDMGLYECTTWTNNWGLHANVTVTVRGPPYRPTLNKAYREPVAVCGNVAVRWTVPFDGNSDIEGHRLECLIRQHEDSNSPGTVVVRDYTSNRTTAYIGGLEARKHYDCRMRSRNAFGISQASNNVNLRCIDSEGEDRLDPTTSTISTLGTAKSSQISMSSDITTQSLSTDQNQNVGKDGLDSATLGVVITILVVILVASIAGVLFYKWRRNRQDKRRLNAETRIDQKLDGMSKQIKMTTKVVYESNAMKADV